MLDKLEAESSDLPEEAEDLNETPEATEGTQEDSELETIDSEDELVYEIEGEQVPYETLKEWRDSGLKEKDYRQKTMAHAEEVKKLSQTRDTLDGRLATFDGMESELKDLLMSEFSSVDMDELRDIDPSEYLKVQNSKDQRSKKFESLISKRNELQQQIIADEQVQLSEIRGWSDPAKREKDIESFNKFASSKGFTGSDMSKLTSSRIMSALIDAAKFSELKESASGKKVKAVAPKAAKPTATKSSKTEKPSMAQRMFGKTSPA